MANKIMMDALGGLAKGLISGFAGKAGGTAFSVFMGAIGLSEESETDRQMLQSLNQIHEDIQQLTEIMHADMERIIQQLKDGQLLDRYHVWVEMNTKMIDIEVKTNNWWDALTRDMADEEAWLKSILDVDHGGFYQFNQLMTYTFSAQGFLSLYADWIIESKESGEAWLHNDRFIDYCNLLLFTMFRLAILLKTAHHLKGNTEREQKTIAYYLDQVKEFEEFSIQKMLNIQDRILLLGHTLTCSGTHSTNWSNRKIAFEGHRFGYETHYNRYAYDNTPQTKAWLEKHPNIPETFGHELAAMEALFLHYRPIPSRESEGKQIKIVYFQTFTQEFYDNNKERLQLADFELQNEEGHTIRPYQSASLYPSTYYPFYYSHYSNKIKSVPKVQLRFEFWIKEGVYVPVKGSHPEVDVPNGKRVAYLQTGPYHVEKLHPTIPNLTIKLDFIDLRYEIDAERTDSQLVYKSWSPYGGGLEMMPNEPPYSFV